MKVINFLCNFWWNSVHVAALMIDLEHWLQKVILQKCFNLLLKFESIISIVQKILPRSEHNKEVF